MIIKIRIHSDLHHKQEWEGWHFIDEVSEISSRVQEKSMREIDDSRGDWDHYFESLVRARPVNYSGTTKASGSQYIDPDEKRPVRVIIARKEDNTEHLIITDRLVFLCNNNGKTIERLNPLVRE